MRDCHAKRMVKELLDNGKVYTVVHYSSGRWSRNVDYTEEVLKLMNPGAVEVGNDAPRGGLRGKFIKLKVG